MPCEILHLAGEILSKYFLNNYRLIRCDRISSLIHLSAARLGE
ncbi:MAG: hypothetical protein K0S31_2022 [Sphingobacterium multivorum]|jgi:hypothetical protein|nr:hypothetical protein [Sphingobacterium multivorum]